uniref:Protein inhibitor of activated STAT, 2 n=1 Tax=Maylandia zebra TaxID=106582 RepID=A0A3P9D3J5_9CICH
MLPKWRKRSFWLSPYFNSASSLCYDCRPPSFADDNGCSRCDAFDQNRRSLMTSSTCAIAIERYSQNLYRWPNLYRFYRISSLSPTPSFIHKHSEKDHECPHQDSICAGPCVPTSTMNLQQPAPPIPPVHPDVQMKPLPFYDVLDVLIKPSSLGASTAQRYHQEKYFIFALTPQQVREVCISRDFLPGGRRDYMVCLSETSCPQEDNYPNSLCIKVNGKLFPLPGYAPPPKNGVEQKRPGRPLNITSLVRLSSAVPNQISVTWTYSMSVYLVRQLTSPLLLQRLRMKGIRNPDHSRALIKEKLTADPDSEIATTSLRVSLMCPLGKMRLMCFDAALYLQMNEKKPTWICPVCDKKAAYESLIIDGLFLEILNDCSDVDEIKFQEDGTWCPNETKERRCKDPHSVRSKASAPLRQPSVAPHSTEPSCTKRADVIDLTIESSSSDDEEDKDPPPKKRCVYISKNEEMHAKVLSYQPLCECQTSRPWDPSYLNSTLADYAVPFIHPSPCLPPHRHQSLDLFSLIQTDHSMFFMFPPFFNMFLDNLTSSMQNAAAATSSHYDAISHAASSFHDTRVLTGGGGGTGGGADGGTSDIISLD